jgi:hypothetical protein
MTIYDETYESLKEFKSAKVHLTSLGKIYNKTEDKLLIKALHPVIQQLTTFVTRSKDSTPRSLIQNPPPPIASLIKYLASMIPTKQPEWQVIALREGWTPPKN